MTDEKEDKKEKKWYEKYFKKSEKSESSHEEDDDWGSWWDGWKKGYGKKEEGKSTTSGWASRFSYYNSYSSSSDVDFDGILRSIRRSANVVCNTDSEEEEERRLNVEWASENGSINRSTDDKIFLSPSVFQDDKCLKKSWKKDEKTDVLIGEALVEATLKKTLDSKIEDTMLKKLNSQRVDDAMEHAVWYLFERLNAEGVVTQDYPGFKGYFAAHRSYHTDAETHDALEDELDEEEDAMTGLQSLIWTMLHPDEPLDMPDETQEFVQESCLDFYSAKDPSARQTIAKKIVERLKSIWGIDNADAIKKGLKDFKNSMQGREAEYNGLPVGSEFLKNTVGKNPGGMPNLFRGQELLGLNSDSRATGLPSAKDGMPEAFTRYGDVVETIHVPPASSRYAQHVKSLKPEIRALRERLKLRNEEHAHYERGLRRGVLDEGSLHKLGFHKLGYDDPTLFEKKEIISKPNVAVGLLVDESGSMCGRIVKARDAAIIIAEALRVIDGAEFCVMGHTGQGFGYSGVNCDGMIIHQYYTPDNPHVESIIRMNAYAQNLDGFAMAYAAKEMMKWYPDHDRKILIHISDGLPAAGGYGGSSAMKHMGEVGDWARKRGVNILGIGVDRAFRPEAGDTMYGRGRYLILDNAKVGVPISNFLSRAIKGTKVKK